jgi:hypothetical protein
VRLGFDRVYEVGELDPVLDEEDREVVADQVVVALAGVELGRAATDVADRVGRAAGAGDGGEAHEHRRAPPGFGEEVRPGYFGEGLIALEVAVGPGPAGVHDPRRDAFVVETGELLPEVEVLHQGRPALPEGQGVVGVIDLDALVGGQLRVLVRDTVVFVQLPLLGIIGAGSVSIIRGRGRGVPLLVRDSGGFAAAIRRPGGLTRTRGPMRCPAQPTSHTGRDGRG